MIFHFTAHPLNIAFSNNVSAAHHHDAVGNNVDFMQDVAGNDDVHSRFGAISEQFNDFGSRHRIEAIERLVKN